MAYSNEQYQALCNAIAQGVTSVKYGDKQVDYRSLNEMLRIKAEMEKDLGVRKGNNRTVIQTSKGLQ